MSNTDNIKQPLTQERILRRREEQQRKSNQIAYEKREREGEPGYPKLEQSQPLAAAWIRRFIWGERAHPGPRRFSVDQAYKEFCMQFPSRPLRKRPFAWFFLTEAWHLPPEPPGLPEPRCAAPARRKEARGE